MTAIGQVTNSFPGWKQVDASIAGMEHVYQLSTNIFSGPTPATTNSLKELSDLGIKTIISVDGAKPDAEAAQALGMRYVHLPIGYDGINPEEQARFAKAVRVLPKPIFIHCHHGKHRGPTAASILCMVEEGWTSDTALAWMRDAGTATNYSGLYRTIREFKTLSPDELKNVSSDFPSRVEVSPMIDAMVFIDERFEHLKLVKNAGFKRPPTHPDIDPPHEALMLEEALRELHRAEATSTNYPPEFVKLLKTSEEASRQLRLLLEKNGRSGDEKALIKAHADLTRTCTDCHRKYRD